MGHFNTEDTTADQQADDHGHSVAGWTGVVGIIIGAAFTAIVNSLVNDLINPIIGLIVGGLDFSSYQISFGAGDHAATLRYGAFLTAVINFLIIAFVVFLLVKAVNRIKDQAMRKGQEVPSAPKGPTQEELLTDIRNILASGSPNVAPAGAASPTVPTPGAAG